MPKFPPAIQELADKFNRFPGIGAKTAERFVFYLLGQPRQDLEKISSLIATLKDKVTLCSVCFNFSDQDPCPICSDAARNRSVICVIAKPQDLAVIENTGEYSGLYHVLGGNLNAIKGIVPEKIRIKELIRRVAEDGGLKEIIIATNHDLEGETTALYLLKTLKPSRLKITRLARGLPMGSDLEYADEITVSSALKERKEIR